ncbi:MAG: hypothetical protein E7Z89_06205 [Cyanobacteria bacterium SIG28]|nr:hypothetical protein [Cyanobacteria bacterium SIG28]
MKNTLILLFLMVSMTNHGHAFDIDETVDDAIRKNYNPNKLILDTDTANLEKNFSSNQNIDENLPELPAITGSKSTKKNSDVKSSNIVAPPAKVIPYTGGNTKIRQGTSFDVVSLNAISDWQTKGTSVSFKTTKNIVKKKYIIPANTVFQGEIVESHSPQITCNGGLVVIQIYSMKYKGQTIPLNAYITRANDKKIFFNNIKGERTFLKTMWKKGDWGRTLFNKMLNLTINLGATTSTLVLSPFPLTYGTICLGANAITSPITAFFSKGGNVSIPANSNFRIKLLDDIMID